MDLTRSATYRTFDFNDVAQGSDSHPLGSRIEEVIWAPVPGVGYTEKRARSSGREASDVYSDGLRLQIRATLFGDSRGDLFDRKNDLMAACNPELAYAEDSDVKGYLPLAYSEATDDTANFASGVRSMFVNVRPLASPGLRFLRDGSGGADTKGFGLPYEVTFEALDPRRYVNSLVQVDMSGAQSGSGTFTHRGNIASPLTIILASLTSSPQDFTFSGNGTSLTISIPDLAGGVHTLTMDPARQHIVVQSYLGNDTIEGGYVTWDTERTLPYVAAGGSAYSWAVDGGVNLQSGSYLQYYEAFAG